MDTSWILFIGILMFFGFVVWTHHEDAINARKHEMEKQVHQLNVENARRRYEMENEMHQVDVEIKRLQLEKLRQEMEADKRLS